MRIASNRPAQPWVATEAVTVSILDQTAEEQAIRALLSGAPAPAGMVRSRVLCMEILHLMADMPGAAQGRAAPPEGASSPEFLERFWKAVQELEKIDPNLLLVTPEMERQFAEGKFNDAVNAKMLAQTPKILEDFGVRSPALSQYLIKQFEAGKLSGAAGGCPPHPHR